MANLLKRICRRIRKWISDMFYAQYIASYSEAGEFDETKRLAQERFGKGQDKGKNKK